MSTHQDLPRSSRDAAGPTQAAARRVVGERDEAGAVIILALVFLVSVSLIVVGLLSYVGTSLTATTSFASERAVETAATNAVNLAISQSRYTFSTQMLNASPPSACWTTGTGQPPAFGGKQFDVWCSMTW
jgi:hypothetical protein